MGGRRTDDRPDQRSFLYGPMVVRFMDGIKWETVCDEFAFDGAWRDIYVLNTDMAAWQRMLDGLLAAKYHIEYLKDDLLTELPADATQAFPLPDGCGRLLSVRFAGVLANCHFFTSEEIEFDIDPRDVKGQEQLDALFGFMRCLADSVDKDAILTWENRREVAIFRVRPRQSGIEYHPVGE